MSMTTLSDRIHPTAVIGAEVELAPDVQVGPFAILEGRIQVGPGCVIEGHACLNGPLVLGRDNVVGHGAILGKSPQLQRDGEPQGDLIIGNGNVFREYVTVHRGSAQGLGVTRIGDRNYFMINSHISHDAFVGSGVTVVNAAMIGSQAELHDDCILSACAEIQSKVRVGRLAMVGGLGSTTKDIPPFILQQGHDSVSGLNIVGLRRAGFTPEALNALRDAFRILYKEGRSQAVALELIEHDFGHILEVAEFTGFIRQSTLGINLARDTARARHGL